MKYPEEFIKKILEEKINNISKLVVKYTPLKQESGLYICRCPFHNGEKNDFFVDIKTNSWFCPVCGETGNAISFIMKKRDYSFDDAVKVLAKRAHIEMPKLEEQDPVDTSANQVYYDINMAAAAFYHEYLLSGKALTGESYLKKRNISLESIFKFRLGVAPKFGQKLYKYLKGKGFSDTELFKSGLIGISEEGKIYDKFRDRIIFPIADKDNRIIGFGGRVLDNSKPKYINSPATPIFEKKENLYGFNLAKNTREDYYIFCEGNVDVISLHQAGFTNAVASLGTALTAEQVSLISEYTDKVLLAYDSDGPGVAAALRAIDLFKNEGIECKVINMLDCKDPDEFIKKYGKKDFLKRIDCTENAQHYKFRKLKETTDPVTYYDMAAEELLKEEGFN